MALIENQEFDLIFMDCQMPEMDGFEATTAIRKFEANEKIARVPIVAFTANAMQGDKENCLNAGMDDYITKPVNIKSLEDVLCKWLPDKVAGSESQLLKDEQDKKQLNDISDDLDLESFNNLRLLFKEKFNSAVEQHSSNAHDNVRLLKQAIEQEDIDTLERAAHSIKGSSAQFGALSLSKLAAEMEQLARVNDLMQAKKLLVELRDCQEQVAQLMQENLDNNNEDPSNSNTA
jgi:CheY-like chemotaxis protein